MVYLLVVPRMKKQLSVIVQPWSLGSLGVFPGPSRKRCYDCGDYVSGCPFPESQAED